LGVTRLKVFPMALGCMGMSGMYGAAEILASRAPTQEEYVARIPAVAIAPWFLAGSLFPITALPGFLTWISRLLPLTHALALIRYGLLDDPAGLHRTRGLRMHRCGVSAAAGNGCGKSESPVRGQRKVILAIVLQCHAAGGCGKICHCAADGVGNWRR